MHKFYFVRHIIHTVNRKNSDFFEIFFKTQRFYSPGPPKSINEILKSKQQMHDKSLQIQFLEPASLCRPPSEPDIKSNNQTKKMHTTPKKKKQNTQLFQTFSFASIKE